MLARLTRHDDCNRIVPKKRSRSRLRRAGATVVEAALVLSVFLMLLFGIFEYCRFLFVLHVTNNAAREGARYASVNCTCTASQASTVQTQIIAYTTQMMSGVQGNISGYEVAVYSVDPTGLTLTPPVIRPATSSTASPPVYPNPFNSSDPNAVSWNSAPFPNRIAVTIAGTYYPVLPSFLLMPTSIPIYITAVLGAE
jgi:Flp pilus assembly protein TadG